MKKRAGYYIFEGMDLLTLHVPNFFDLICQSDYDFKGLFQDEGRGGALAWQNGISAWRKEWRNGAGYFHVLIGIICWKDICS